MKLSPLALASVLSLSVAAAAAAAAPDKPLTPLVQRDPLEAAFRTPPADAYPRTFWFWMNGHVTRDGITRDLEAMHRVGVSGVLIYDGGQYLPAGPVGFLDPQWQALMTHAIRVGRRLGIGIGMHNAPGWSSTGGPWITPALSMQQLVWTTSTVRGGHTVDLALPQPQTNEGYYRDVAVVAFPAAPGAQVPYAEAIRAVTVGGQPIAKGLLSDGRIDQGVTVAPDKPVLIEFAAPEQIYAVTANTTTNGRFPRLRVEASSDGTHFQPVCTVGSPGKHGIAAPGVASFPPVRARFFRVTPSGTGDLAEFVLHRSPRLKDWNYLANYAYRIGDQLVIDPAGNPAVAIDPKSVRDLSAQLDAQGHLHWDAPAGVWTVLRLGQTSTGQLNVSASAAGTGLECDKFNPAAVAFSFHHVEEKIIANAGPDKAGFTAASIDSYEAGMQNWTADFPQEFRRREGYDIGPFLPALTGRIVGDTATTERFLYDFRRAQADLMADAYYRKMGELCHAHGLVYYMEGYGQGVFDEMDVSGISDVPMGEFWTRTPWAPNRTVKMVSSAAHIYGKRIVGAESYTGEERTSRWEDYPYSMKVLGDDMFAQGVNQITFHRYAHQPHPTAVPGMAMGPWGFEFERTNTWFGESKSWIDYLTRVQAVLRHGTYVADFLYFTGERPPNNAQFMMPPLPQGYTYDLATADALINRVRVEDGEFVLPDGPRYRVLVLPSDLHVMTPEMIRKLREFVRAGAVVVGPKPVGSPTLRGFPASNDEVRRIADELWNPAAPRHVISDRTVDEVIRDLKMTPDFDYLARHRSTELSWCHRHLADGTDVYFVANRQRLPVDFLASFRVNGRQPEVWNPETGTTRQAAVFDVTGDRTQLPLHLRPAESVFVVFRKKLAPGRAATGETWVARGDHRLIDLSVKQKPGPTETNTFTMSIWAKPDVELRLMPHESTTGRVDETGKFYAIPAAEGDVVYGPGHVIAGLAVGRNGAYVIERSRASSPAVLVSHQPISGWTLFTVVYRDGTPRLYINGQFVRQGLKSGAIVHPGVDSPPPRPDTSYYFKALNAVAKQSHIPLPSSQGHAFLFEGNLTRPELFDSALSDAAIADIARRGLPPLPGPRPVEINRVGDGELVGRFWQSGDYTTSSGAALKVFVPAPQPVHGPWTVSFEPGRGAPDRITLPHLAPLEDNQDPGVRYFSGTATYTQLVTVPDDFIGYGHHVMLDLGRVEVLADVTVNGQRIGTVWKEPYRIDISPAVHAGANRIEINVTNLWPNRLIGDENLPAENQYETGDSHGIKKVPDWYLRGEPKPAGGRVTFVTWHFFDRGEPLLASGLLGPVTLRCMVERPLPPAQPAPVAAQP